LNVTIKDVAKKADVSIATVSRFLNNKPKVSKGAKQRIANAISELKYEPYAMAKGLIKRKMKTIGLLMPDIRNLFYPIVIKGVEDELEKNNYNIFVCHSDEKIDKEKKYLDTLLDKGVEGIIFLGTRSPKKEKNDHILELSNSIPILMINEYLIGSNVYSVMSDQVEGAYKAITYLIENGHREIAFINGNTDYTTYRHKLRGFMKAFNDYSIEPNEDFIIKTTPYEDGGYDGANKILSHNEKPTAFFTASDQIAYGSIRALIEKGFNVPKDFSVIGYGNIDISANIYPELTTVDQFPYKTGKMAAKKIINILEKEGLDQKKILIEPELVIRKSSRSIK